MSASNFLKGNNTMDIPIVKDATTNTNTNTNTTVTTADGPPEKKEKKPKKDTLPAKFSKNMTFTYWFLTKIQEENGYWDAESFDAIRASLTMMYATVKEQSEYYKAFEDDSAMLSKELKKMIKVFHKPPKEKKAPKTNAKRGRKKKEEVDNATDDVKSIVDDIVAAATSGIPKTETEINTDEAAAKKPKRKYTRKAKPTLDTKEAEVEDDTKEAELKEDTKEAELKEDANEELLSDAEDEIVTLEFTFKDDGFLCLRQEFPNDDLSFSLFDRNTHELIHSHTLCATKDRTHFIDHHNNLY